MGHKDKFHELGFQSLMYQIISFKVGTTKLLGSIKCCMAMRRMSKFLCFAAISNIVVTAASVRAKRRRAGLNCDLNQYKYV